MNLNKNQQLLKDTDIKLDVVANFGISAILILTLILIIVSTNTHSIF